MKTVFAAGLAGAALLMLASPAAAQNTTVGAHAATTGFGPDLQYRLNDQLSVRAAADWLEFRLNRTYDNVGYDGRLRFLTGSAFLDWHPWANAFFLSAGGYFGDRKLHITATPQAPLTLGGQLFTPAQVGHLNGDIKLASASPFVGFGVDSNAAADARGLGFKGVLGVAFSGKPSVTLTSSGGVLTGQALLQQALIAEQSSIANKASFLQYYPVVQAGVTYRF